MSNVKIGADLVVITEKISSSTYFIVIPDTFNYNTQYRIVVTLQRVHITPNAVVIPLKVSHVSVHGIVIADKIVLVSNENAMITYVTHVL